MNDELLALDETGLDAAVRECARITRPEISDDEFEQIKADNSPRYQNTRTEMGRAIRAYLRAAKPALSSIVTCCVTGAIPGDGGACGDCDPCLFSEASLPSPVKRLIAEKNSLLHRIGELEDKLAETLTAPGATTKSDGGVKVRELEWEDADEGMCTKWRACALGGHYELVALDGDGGGLAVNFYWGRPLSFWFIQGEPDEWGPTGPKMFPTLDEAKAAARADYEARIRSALVSAPPQSASGGALLEAAAKIASTYEGVNFPPAHRHANIIAQAIRALAASEATKSDGGAKAGSSPILANKEDQRPDTHGMMPVGDNAANVGSTGVGPSEPSSTRSEVTVEFGELVDDLLSVTAEVRRQNWKNGGAHLYDDEDAARKITRALLDQFQIRRK